MTVLFNDESRLAQVVPILGIGLAYHLGVIDFHLAVDQGQGRKGHGHAVVVVGVEGFPRGITVSAFPNEFPVVVISDHHTDFPQFCLHGFDAVGLLDFQRAQSREIEGYA